MWIFKRKHIYSVWYITQGYLNTKRHTYVKARDIAHATKIIENKEVWPITITDFEVVN